MKVCEEGVLNLYPRDLEMGSIWGGGSSHGEILSLYVTNLSPSFLARPGP